MIVVGGVEWSLWGETDKRFNQKVHSVRSINDYKCAYIAKRKKSLNFTNSSVLQRNRTDEQAPNRAFATEHEQNNGDLRTQSLLEQFTRVILPAVVALRS